MNKLIPRNDEPMKRRITSARRRIVCVKPGKLSRFYNSMTHGLLLHGGNFASIDVPGATVTIAGGINYEGDVVGSYTDANGKAHGFLLSHGEYTTIDDPNAGPPGTNAWDINTADTVVCSYADSKGTPRGYSLRHGEFETIVVPGSLSGFAFGINPQGDIVGQYTDAHGMTHGFLLGHEGTDK
jgi:hypothetical protein